MSKPNKNAPKFPRERGSMTPQPSGEYVQVNGFEQILEMLRIADPSFRDQILRNVAKRDPGLARKLILQLG